MREKINPEEVIGAIRLLNLSGERIVFIDGEFFIPTRFDHAENSVQLHYLEGKDITDILRKYAGNYNLTETQVAVIKNEITALERVTRKYHKETWWKVYDISVRM